MGLILGLLQGLKWEQGGGAEPHSPPHLIVWRRPSIYWSQKKSNRPMWRSFYYIRRRSTIFAQTSTTASECLCISCLRTVHGKKKWYTSSTSSLIIHSQTFLSASPHVILMCTQGGVVQQLSLAWWWQYICLCTEYWKHYTRSHVQSRAGKILVF